MTPKEMIKALSAKREKLVKLMDDDSSWNEEKESELDNLAAELYKLIKEERNNLTVEYIFEELTLLGDAPCLLYDDNGHWAIIGNCYSSTCLEEPINMEMHFLVESSHWKNTIREALDDYFSEEEIPEEKPEEKAEKTVGELLAEQLKGEPVSNEQIAKATKDFFESRGINCTVSIGGIQLK